MSWKAIAGSILFILILLAGSNFVTWKLTTKALKKDFIASVTKDSSETIIDTVWLKPDTIRIKSFVIIKPEVDTLENIILYSAGFDTTIIENDDTLAVIKEEIIFDGNVFEVLRDIVIMPVEKLVIIENTKWQTAIVEVPADPPFHNTWIAGFISGVVSFLIIVIALL